MTHEEIISLITSISKYEGPNDYLGNKLFSNIEKFSSASEISDFIYKEKTKYKKEALLFSHLGFFCEAYYFINKLTTEYILPKEELVNAKLFIEWIYEELNSIKEIKLEDPSQFLTIVNLYKSLNPRFCGNAHIMWEEGWPQTPKEVFDDFFVDGKNILAGIDRDSYYWYPVDDSWDDYIKDYVEYKKYIKKGNHDVNQTDQSE